MIPIKIVKEVSSDLKNEATPTVTWRKERPQASPERLVGPSKINEAPAPFDKMKSVSTKPPTVPLPPPPPPPQPPKNLPPPPPMPQTADVSPQPPGKRRAY